MAESSPQSKQAEPIEQAEPIKQAEHEHHSATVPPAEVWTIVSTYLKSTGATELDSHGVMRHMRSSSTHLITPPCLLVERGVVVMPAIRELTTLRNYTVPSYATTGVSEEKWLMICITVSQENFDIVNMMPSSSIWQLTHTNA